MIIIKILALDQAKLTGYAVFEEDALIDYGKIELGKKDEIYENILFKAREKIKNLIKTAQPDIIAIEDIQQQNQNVSTYKKLAMLMGALISLFQELEIPFNIVPPMRWKSFARIQGRQRIEQKRSTVAFAKEKFNLDSVTEDEADAISIGYWAVNHI